MSINPATGRANKHTHIMKRPNRGMIEKPSINPHPHPNAKEIPIEMISDAMKYAYVKNKIRFLIS